MRKLARREEPCDLVLVSIGKKMEMKKEEEERNENGRMHNTYQH
jgi:hypothetical protein